MIDAVAELTAERGYEATKIADVVRRARVARKTLYDNFDGKEDLFLAAIDLNLREVRSQVQGACAAAEESWRQRVQDGLAAFLEFVARKPAAARMCLVEAASATAASAVQYQAALHGFVELLGEAVPPHPGLPGTIEETLIGGIAWITSQQIRRGEAESVGDLLPELSTFLLSPYHGVGEIGIGPRGESDSTVADSNI
jgi:AcrR family transcriptional regulator